MFAIDKTKYLPYLCRAKQKVNIMKPYNITDDIYFEMINRAERYENVYWDCIELSDGCAVTFALESGKPYDVEVYDEDDNILVNNFNLSRFEMLAA